MKDIAKFLCAVLLLCAGIGTFTACDTIKVNGVSLDKTEMSVAVDSGFLLTPTIAPEKAKTKTVTWSSDSPDIASVSDYGWVEGKSEGVATITVTTDDGAFTASCNVTITSPTGKTKAQVKAAFEAAGYTETYSFGIDSAFLPAYTYTKGESSFIAIFGTSEEIAATVKPAFDEIAQANGLTCQQDGRIIYYGAADAIIIFEAIQF
ncbi:MAG: Ig-like domain-containing protein [Dehalococcoidia bacterium]|nr:Ig-like domain-containing protein [Dehalococcoidia bacterium]